MMIMSMTKFSVYISYLLRHQPEAIGLGMDIHGWVSVTELIKKINETGRYCITESILADIVRTDNKGRFRYSEDGTKIKACQGHSISWVEPELTLGQPLEYLYHGTTEESCRRSGKVVISVKWAAMLSICRQRKQRHGSLLSGGIRHRWF